MARTARVVLAVAASGMLVGGCGGGASPHVATAQPSTVVSAGPGSPAPSPSKESDYDKALRYTRCMTAHGAPTPDPVVGVPIGSHDDFGPGVNADEVNARYQANKLCKQFLPATWRVKVDPAEVARSARYTDCMIKHGIPEPKPDAQGFIDEPTDDALSRMPGYNAAVAACRHLIDDKANNQPGNN